MKFWPRKKISVSEFFSSLPLHSLPYKQRCKFILIFHFRYRLLGFSSFWLNTLWILRAYQHIPPNQEHLYDYNSDLSFYPHLLLSTILLLSLLQLTSVYPQGYYWTSNHEHITWPLNIFYAVGQWYLTCRVVMKIGIREIVHVQCSSRTVPGIESKS